ncbi:uncharacterized protein MONBRDRAFT_18960 [Monosiga brevicollis MX1]|uniref:beta-N-acetylhexosaminidase n=1 Tax=Monosiga brevicollis TaxID=81824 RepID=A9UXK6_MONBE|nr:uncharacterized protein MONBRDRAFT_18960 [Monosiga brevicollis MX1]EDQ89857.1 predicted protein [Monosiga brevicollis MX1]|eukprot:XP_001745279.1 hypothetical protein [Monosiga brevicollis MX1]
MVTADTIYGAMRALETISQLIQFDYDTNNYFIANAPWAITDFPRFAHREILVDTARHYQSVMAIKSMIDSMTYAKVNVVHWHIVDTQSFPFMSPTYPELGSKGAYSKTERFSPADVAEVVEYARQRGVRVMVEIDTPGHAASWCNGHPEICPSPDCPQPLNPATNKTFDVLSGLFKDVTGGERGAGLFPDNVMHLGGDEVNTDCWASNADISKWLSDQGLTLDGGYAYFVKRAQAIAHGYGRDVVGWEEIWDHFGTQLDKSTIIHQWLGARHASLNLLRPAGALTAGIGYLDGLDVTWQTMYEQEPCTGMTDDQCALVLGGGGEMWGETVDFSDWHQTVWPRMAAVAERLWSPRELTNADDASTRLVAYRCLLNHRAIAAAPSTNSGARTAPSGPGSCYDQ